MNMDVKKLVETLKLEGINDIKVLEAINNVLRENFVLEWYKDRAYHNEAILIVENQTISQPYTVAFMLQELELQLGDKVLEIGAGSGWNSALIQFITKTKVYTLEFNNKVAEFAKNNLMKNKIQNVELVIKDGNNGYEKEKPYDKIIITAACSKIPLDLIKQLKDNGIMLVPVGNLHEQDLLKIIKTKEGYKKFNLGKFVFVPLKGKYGF